MENYEKLKEQLSQITTIDRIASVLYWDMDVSMPPKALNNRAMQLSFLEVQKDRIYKSEEFAKNLAASEKEVMENGSDWDKANFGIAKKRHAYQTAVPESFVKEFAEAKAMSHNVWKEARKKNDFAMFLPHLEKMFSLTKQRADILSKKLGIKPYDVLLGEFQPGLKDADIAPVFADLKVFLPKFYDEVEAKQANMEKPVFEDKYDVEKQKRISRLVSNKMGYDYGRGVLAESEHPYTCGEDPTDVRITTHYFTDNPLDPVSSTVHEAGHAVYQQCLPDEDQPVASAAGMAIHESQSLLAENCFGKSKEYAEYLSGVFQKEFGEDKNLTTEAIYATFNKQEKSFIRTQASEVTYPLHVIMRYEIEKDIIEGKMECKDMPKVWNSKMKEYLGIEPKNDAEGCMQDVHWSEALIGYFPSYSLGAIVAAQKLEAIKEANPDVMEKAKKGDLSVMCEFTKENVGKYGASLEFAEAVKASTGKPFSADAYKRYLRAKLIDDKQDSNTKTISPALLKKQKGLSK